MACCGVLPAKLLCQTVFSDDEHCGSEISSENVFLQMATSSDFVEVLSRQPQIEIIQTVLKHTKEASNTCYEWETDDLLSVAVAALQLFVQHNWTGPFTLSAHVLSAAIHMDVEAMESRECEWKSLLTVDGEPIYERVNFPVLLFIARQILSSQLKSHPRKPTEWLIWEMRSVFVHQSMIEEHCSTLKTEAMFCIDSLMSLAGIKLEEEAVVMNVESMSEAEKTMFADAELKRKSLQEAYPAQDCCCLNSLISWQIEAASQSRFYFEHRTCKALLANARLQCPVDIQLDGVPGKRTKFQEKNIAQLVLKVTSKQHSNGACLAYSAQVCQNVPQNELLNDDTVLDKMKLVDDSSEAGDSERISPEVDTDWLNQCLIMALCEENNYIKAADPEITAEETQAYLNYLIGHPVDWSVQCKALLLRSLNEKNSGRRVERSLRQLEYLSSITTHTKATVAERLHAVYSVMLPPSWQISRSLGELQMDIGVFASAMEVFDRLSLWHPLIVCSQRSGRTGKAEELIRQRLSVEESPPLYCSLSDVTADPQYYYKAWELSNRRSARAMRGLAFHYLRATEYEKAIECFEKTLALNPLQISCWFSFGCACLASANYNKAATAFRRCVILNEDNYEAWNNLAAAYIRNNQKPRGFAVLQDSIKCSYDNWKVWENYSLVGSDCGQIAEVIRAAHRILELKGKWEDEMVAKHLTKCIMDDIVDATGKPSSTHREAMLKLLGHTTAKVTTNSVIWMCYGQLILHTQDNNVDNMERGIQCLQKAYRCASSASNWERTEETCTTNTELLLQLVTAYELLNNKKYGSTGKLQIKSHIARLTKAYTDPVTKRIDNQNITEQLAKLDEKLIKCEEMIKNG